MDMTPVKSSNIAAVGHEGDTLHVQFKNGKTYAYEGVSADKHQALMTAESPTKHLNAEIRPAHKCSPL